MFEKLETNPLLTEFNEVSQDWLSSVESRHGHVIKRLVLAGIACKMHMYAIASHTEILKLAGKTLDEHGVHTPLEMQAKAIWDVADRFSKVHFSHTLALVHPNITEDEGKLIEDLANEYCDKIVQWRDDRMSEIKLKS
jgi:hypothetical protein